MRIALTYNVRLTSSEEEAEFDSPEPIDTIARALEKVGHTVERCEVTGPASRLVAHLEAFAPDLIFNTAEGRRGKMRRGFYPALFEELGMPYTGSDSYALCVTLDKALTKRILAGFGIPSPRGRLVTRETLRAGGLDDFLETYAEGVLVERFLLGTDVRAVRIDGVTKLAPVEVVVDPTYARRFEVLDYALKHEHSSFVTRRTPPRLPAKVIDRLDDLASRAFDALGMRDAAALDFRVGIDGEIHFLSAAFIALVSRTTFSTAYGT